jgi:hypothetical protein
MKIQVVVFWVEKPCSFLGHPHLRGLYYLQFYFTLHIKWRWRQQDPPKRWYPTTLLTTRRHNPEDHD